MSPLRQTAARGCLAILSALACVLALAPVAAQAAAPSSASAAARAHSTPPHSTRTDGLSNVLGDYDREIRESAPRADGLTHVDTPATIAALEKAHVNTYAYLVWHSASDWDDLVNEFLPAAQRAQINVWVYLVPPSECCSQPYGADYIAWAQAIATLSNQYPSLTAWVMDDFLSNTSTFTGAYVKQMQDSAKAINPKLELFTIVYPGQYTAAFADTYGANIDGAIFPYTGAHDDLNDLGPLQTELDAAVDALKPLGKRLYLMPYAAKLSSAPHPATADTIATMLELGRQYMRSGRLDGIMIYLTPLDPVVEPCVPEQFPNTLALRVSAQTPTPGGDYVQASQQVAVDPDASTYSVSFQQRDSFMVYPADLGYYTKQLLVDGHVVWEQDVADDAASTWFPETVDLTAALAGKTSATLAFRLANPQGVHNFGLVFSLADVTGAGVTISDGDFAAHEGWTFESTSPAFEGIYSSYTCDPNLEFEIFDAVQASYGPTSLVYRAESATGVRPGVRHALATLASLALRQHEHGREQAAVGMTHALSRLAAAVGLPVLSAQAAAVADELG